jgi:tRNA modification GTPase
VVQNVSSGYTDTIVALATPPGRGGIGVIRISGPAAPDLSLAILGRLPDPRLACFGHFLDGRGDPIDDGLALYFPAPHSFTGENVLELHGHGGPVVQDMLLARALELGARMAEPGEFSRRAFLNDKLDLAQAEAIADLIDSGSEQAARAALRSLEGEFSRRVNTLVEALVQCRIYVEAAIDFPEEEIDFLSDEEILRRIQSLFQAFDALERDARQGCLLQEGMRVVILGRPNAGKSSLLNALSGYEAAIVTEVPGTTRDVLRERIHIDGMPLHIIDTAGLRDDADRIEAEGMRRARHELTLADRVLLVTDACRSGADGGQDLLAEVPANIPVSIVRNKIDLAMEAPGIREGIHTELSLSALTGEGVDLLRQHLKSCMGFRSGDSGTLSARRRHLDALRRAREHFEEGCRQLREQRAGELMAEELRVAQQALAEITGEFSSDDLLGRIFSSFCIGK